MKEHESITDTRTSGDTMGNVMADMLSVSLMERLSLASLQ